MRYLFIFVFLSFVFISCKNHGTKLKYDQNELYYTDKVNEEQAKKLGSFLEQSGFFQKRDKTISVQLDKDADTFLFRMVVLKEFRDDPSYIEKGKVFSNEISTNVFSGSPVVMHFCDDKLETERIVRP